jgi:hypothetical protein
VYEELARQAIRHQTKVDVTSLCLSVLGGRAADAISKAISKCLKEKQFYLPGNLDLVIFSSYCCLSLSEHVLVHLCLVPIIVKHQCLKRKVSKAGY